jgi:uncharacterized protein (DUF1330 family)
MSAYLVADIEVLDPAKYAEYVQAARPIVLAYGGRYLVRGGRSFPLSGDWSPERLLIIEFDSLAALRRCLESEAYRRVAPLRMASTRSRSLIVEGTSEEAGLAPGALS